MTSQQRKLQTHLYYIQYVSRCYEKLSYGNRRFQQNMIKFALVYLHFHTRKLTHIWQIQKATSHTECMKNEKARHFLESVQKIAFFSVIVCLFAKNHEPPLSIYYMRIYTIVSCLLVISQYILILYVCIVVQFHEFQTSTSSSSSNSGTCIGSRLNTQTQLVVCSFSFSFVESDCALETHSDN